MTAAVAGLQAADILVDDFSSGSVGIDGRIFLRDIDTGWYGPNGVDQERVISKGKMQNSAATPGSFPAEIPAEGGFFRLLLKIAEVEFVK